MMELKHMTMFLTTQCNLTCTYCFCGKKYNSSMKWNVAVGAVNFFEKNRDYKDNTITFFGGEPLIEKELLFRIADYVMENCPDIKMHVTTNGTLLSEGVYDELKKRNINILLSLDGYEENHDFYRKYTSGKGSWNTIIRNLNSLHIDVFPPIRMTVTVKNVEKLSSNVINLYNMGFKSIAFYIAYEDKWDENKIYIYESEYRKIALFYEQCFENGQPIYIDSIDKVIDSNINNIINQCAIGNQCISVLPDGTFYPCHRIDFTKKPLNMGDVYNGVKKEACEFYRNILDLSDPECDECVLHTRCLQCPIQNKNITGGYHLVPEISCEVNRIHIVYGDKIAGDLYQSNNNMFLKKFYNS